MKKALLIAALLLGVTMTVAGPQLPQPEMQAVGLGPREVVQSFYDEYLGYISEGDALRNPLTDGSYRSSPHLARQLVARVDALVAGFEKGGFDPFLMAQDVPEHLAAGEAVVAGRQATVPVTTSFPGHRFTVELKKQADGRWLIVTMTPAQ